MKPVFAWMKSEEWNEWNLEEKGQKQTKNKAFDQNPLNQVRIYFLWLVENML